MTTNSSGKGLAAGSPRGLDNTVLTRLSTQVCDRSLLAQISVLDTWQPDHWGHVGGRRADARAP
jgi:hypothetical protein